MKNKGFTLIEVLAVVLILSFLALIILPKVNSIIKENKVKACNSIIDDFIDAAHNYTYLHTTEIEEDIANNEYSDVSISSLINDGFVSRNLKNPLTNNAILTSNVVRITSGNNGYIYTYMGDDCK